MKKSLVLSLLAAFLLASLPLLAGQNKTAPHNNMNNAPVAKQGNPSVNIRRAFHSCKAIPENDRKEFRGKQDAFRKEMRANKGLTKEQRQAKAKEHHQVMENEMVQILQKNHCQY